MSEYKEKDLVIPPVVKLGGIFFFLIFEIKMQKLEKLKQLNVDVSKFLLVTTPNFEWNITKQQFTFSTLEHSSCEFEDNRKIYSVAPFPLNNELLEIINKHNGFIAWLPCKDENVLRYALLAQDLPTKFYVFVVSQDLNSGRIIPDFKCFETEQEVLNFHLEEIQDKFLKIVYFKIIKGVEKNLEPFEVVTKYKLK